MKSKPLESVISISSITIRERVIIAEDLASILRSIEAREGFFGFTSKEDFSTDHQSIDK